MLHQQVVDERESRKTSGTVGHHPQPRTKRRRMFTTLHQRYLRCELLYAKDQRQEVNRQELTPSLNYQVRGTRLQDGVLWDVEPGECPFSCSLCASRCQVVFEDVHRYAIANVIDLLSKKKKKVGGERQISRRRRVLRWFLGLWQTC